MFYVAGSNEVCMKSKLRDKRIPFSFFAARRIPELAAAVDRVFEALITRRTWKYVDKRPKVYVLPFTWNFCIKEATGQHANILHNAKCCLRRDKQRSYLDFDPYELYAPVVRPENIQSLISKVAAQNLIFEGVGMSNAYLYRDLQVPVYGIADRFEWPAKGPRKRLQIPKVNLWNDRSQQNMGYPTAFEFHLLRLQADS